MCECAQVIRPKIHRRKSNSSLASTATSRPIRQKAKARSCARIDSGGAINPFADGMWRGPFEDMAKGREIHRFGEKHIEAGVASAVVVGEGKISAHRDRRQSG